MPCYLTISRYTVPKISQSIAPLSAWFKLTVYVRTVSKMSWLLPCFTGAWFKLTISVSTVSKMSWFLPGFTGTCERKNFNWVYTSTLFCPARETTLVCTSTLFCPASQCAVSRMLETFNVIGQLFEHVLQTVTHIVFEHVQHIVSITHITVSNTTLLTQWRIQI